MAMLSNLGNYKNFGLLVIRLGLGAMFIYHGLPKLEGGPEMWKGLGGAAANVGITFWPVLWGFLSALVEAGGGVLLILGLGFRPVCVLLLINLIVAASFLFHKGDGWAGAAHPIEDAIMFAGLLFVGPGKYSVDKR
ncbi:putative oxidoreductase [Mucilaginibacter yixingensis]|uniref:Putative oxidoreductase n=1 Tax=Mucilaginibacter yixingensis TaxID=1295612 RepID=A0A2T5JDD3_9SPHI|nr:DoxX family protein [Mucilaginibacter yixingensis]PTQ99778.1 putative oxidoreductase [Mucilaginibacter yixingensis]